MLCLVAPREDVRLIVASHHALAPGAARDTHRAWNGNQVAALLNSSAWLEQTLQLAAAPFQLKAGDAGAAVRRLPKRLLRPWRFLMVLGARCTHEPPLSCS